MRRGTQAAILFGELLYELRVAKGFTMRHVGLKIGAPPATVSQCEKAQRAVKEPKLEDWAHALEVDVSFLRERWLHFQREHPDGPINRNRGKSLTTKQLVVNELQQLTAPERQQVIGYIHRLLEERKDHDG